MANFLSADQRAAFSGGYYDLANFPKRVEIDDGLGGIFDISGRIHKLGETRIVLHGWNPAAATDLVFPSLSSIFVNEDGYLTPGRSGSLWGSRSPAEFLFRFRIFDLLTDPSGGKTLVDETFAVIEVQLNERLATIVSIAKLARHWAERWKLEDREEIDWNGLDRLWQMS